MLAELAISLWLMVGLALRMGLVAQMESHLSHQLEQEFALPEGSVETLPVTLCICSPLNPSVLSYFRVPSAKTELGF